MDSIWCRGIQTKKPLRKIVAVHKKSGEILDCYSMLINTKRNKNAILREYLANVVSTKKKNILSSRFSDWK